MRASDFVIDVLEESTNEMRLMLEQNPALFESLSGWDEINKVLESIDSEQASVGDNFAILSLTFTPPGKSLIIKGHHVPSELINVSTNGYTKYTFNIDGKTVTYPAQFDAGDLSYKSFLFKSDSDLSKALTFIVMSLEGWRISNHLQEAQQVTELFNPAAAFPLEWDDQFGPREMHATAYDRQGRTISIDFVPITENMIEIEFTRGGSYDITGRGDAPMVLTTVLEAIKTYLSKYYAAPYVVFSSSNKEASRTGVYQAMIKRLAGALGYVQITPKSITPSTFMLKRKDLADPVPSDSL